METVGHLPGDLLLLEDIEDVGQLSLEFSLLSSRSQGHGVRWTDLEVLPSFCRGHRYRGASSWRSATARGHRGCWTALPGETGILS
jgi:hypothetical protein